MLIRAAELIPAATEQAPSDDRSMTGYLRKVAFRVVSDRLLRAMVTINSIEEGQTAGDWRRLETGKPVYEELHNGRLFSAEQRAVVLSTVATDMTSLGLPKAVTASIHVFRGDDEVRITKDQGFEYPNHNGQLSSFHIRGVIGGEGNAAFNREELDCEPELQRLAISPLGYSGKAIEYAFFGKPPMGGQEIINFSKQVSEFLEAIPIV